MTEEKQKQVPEEETEVSEDEIEFVRVEPSPKTLAKQLRSGTPIDGRKLAAASGDMSISERPLMYREFQKFLDWIKQLTARTNLFIRKTNEHSEEIENLKKQVAALEDLTKNLKSKEKGKGGD
jgi:hypothetical protein